MRVLTLFLLLFSLVACSQNNVSDKTVFGNAVLDKKATPKPANFDEYKEWRKVNDPAGQSYAEFKDWERAYQRWKMEQSVP